MKSLKPKQLKQILRHSFPPHACSWVDATDELRDMCRVARVMANTPEADCCDFSKIREPSVWNACGVDFTVKFYRMLNKDGRKKYCKRFNTWLSNWAKQLNN